MYVVATPSTKTANCLALALFFVKILFEYVRNMYNIYMYVPTLGWLFETKSILGFAYISSKFLLTYTLNSHYDYLQNDRKKYENRCGQEKENKFYPS